jgi:hypothetical protein
MEGTQITTAHLAIGVAMVGVMAAIGTPIGLFLLQRMFGSGDKAAGEIKELKDKVHALEVAGMTGLIQTREHVAAQFATKTDIAELKETVRGFAQSQQQYHEALMTLLTPIANQLIGVSPVRKS